MTLTVDLTADDAVDLTRGRSLLLHGLEIAEGDHPVDERPGWPSRRAPGGRAVAPWLAVGRLPPREAACACPRDRWASSDEEWNGERRSLRVYPRAGARARAPCGRRDAGSSRATRSRARRARGSSTPTRPFAPGDRLRSINWRARARRRSLVSQRVPSGAEHGRILFLEAFAQACSGRAEHVDEAVRPRRPF